MQLLKDNKIVGSNVGEMKELLKQAGKALKNSKADTVVISSFHEGETIMLRGIKFKITSNNQKARRLTLKML